MNKVLPVSSASIDGRVRATVLHPAPQSEKHSVVQQVQLKVIE